LEWLHTTTTIWTLASVSILLPELAGNLQKVVRNEHTDTKIIVSVDYDNLPIRCCYCWDLNHCQCDCTLHPSSKRTWSALQRRRPGESRDISWYMSTVGPANYNKETEVDNTGSSSKPPSIESEWKDVTTKRHQVTKQPSRPIARWDM
jgi:hypothetical protein